MFVLVLVLVLQVPEKSHLISLDRTPKILCGISPLDDLPESSSLDMSGTPLMACLYTAFQMDVELAGTLDCFGRGGPPLGVRP